MDSFVEIRTQKDQLNDIKQKILEKTNGICACCGKKLSIETVQVDQMIPNYYNGKKELSNLMPLCYQCKQQKQDHLYLPSNFYKHLPETEQKQTIFYFKTWYQTSNIRKHIQIRPMILPEQTISFLSETLEIQQISWHNIQEIHDNLSIDLTASKQIINQVYKTNGLPVSYYQVKNKNNTICVMTVLFDQEKNYLVFHVPYCNLPEKKQMKLLPELIAPFLNSIEKFADIPVYGYTVISMYQELLSIEMWPYNFTSGIAYTRNHNNQISQMIVLHVVLKKEGFPKLYQECKSEIDYLHNTCAKTS